MERWVGEKSGEVGGVEGWRGGWGERRRDVGGREEWRGGWGRGGWRDTCDTTSYCTIIPFHVSMPLALTYGQCCPQSVILHHTLLLRGEELKEQFCKYSRQHTSPRFVRWPGGSVPVGVIMWFELEPTISMFSLFSLGCLHMLFLQVKVTTLV